MYELVRDTRILTIDYPFSFIIKDDKVLKGGYKKDRNSLFIRIDMERTRYNGHRLQKERFHLEIGKKLFTGRSITGTTS